MEKLNFFKFYSIILFTSFSSFFSEYKICSEKFFYLTELVSFRYKYLHEIFTEKLFITRFQQDIVKQQASTLLVEVVLVNMPTNTKISNFLVYLGFESAYYTKHEIKLCNAKGQKVQTDAHSRKPFQIVSKSNSNLYFGAAFVTRLRFQLETASNTIFDKFSSFSNNSL